MSFLVWVYTSQDFAQTQQNFARSHDRETVTFRNSALHGQPPNQIVRPGAVSKPASRLGKEEVQSVDNAVQCGAAML